MFARKIANYKSNLFMDTEKSIEIAGIKEYYRRMYIFIDRDEYQQFGTVKSGKMFLINCSMTYTTKNLYINHGELLRFVINMYSFQVEFINGFRNLDTSICTLEEGYLNDGYNDLIKRRYNPENQILYDNLRSLNNPYLKEELLNTEYQSYDVLPDPKYYTSNQQWLAEKEEPCPLNSIYHTLVYKLGDLKDNKTEIVILRNSDWQTFVEKKLQTLRTIREEDYYDPIAQKVNINLLLQDLFFYNAETNLQGLIFSYDSQVGDVIITHDKRFPVTMSFANHRFDEQKTKHILDLKERLNKSIKSMENEHGSLLLYYSPYLQGDFFQVHFKDYKKENQPIVTESNKIDKIYSLDSAIIDWANTTE